MSLESTGTRRRASWWPARADLGTLFFLHGMAMATWFVPLSPVLEAHGLPWMRPWAFATSSLAALVSPLLFGAIADRHFPPIRVLRWLCVGSAVLTALASLAIRQGWASGVILGAIQLQALVSAPTWSLSTTVVLARLTDPRKEFGPIRSLGTMGWVAGCWLVSALRADASTLAGFSGAVLWVVVAGFSRWIPGEMPAAATGPLSIRQRLGLDALSLLRHPDHRAVFLTAALGAVPLSAFWPYTPPHLRDLGFERSSAWMSLGQATEILAMFGLASLLGRFRLKWILACGLGCALLRYVLFALDTGPAVLAGISLHGLAFTLFFITTPIYLGERVDPAWRARAQALMTLMAMGLGNLVGYLATGWWMSLCRGPQGTDWPRFWGGLAVVLVVVVAYFLASYRGRSRAS